MKKFIICLLLICIIVLGCFALTACNENGGNEDNTSGIEYVTNKYSVYSRPNQLRNEYYFRFWYPMNWFKQDLSYTVRYKLSPEDEYIDFESRDFYGQVMGENHAVATCPPDTWIYIIHTFDVEPSDLYIQVISISYTENRERVYNDVLLSAHFNLEGTYKTA